MVAHASAAHCVLFRGTSPPATIETIDSGSTSARTLADHLVLISPSELKFEWNG